MFGEKLSYKELLALRVQAAKDRLLNLKKDGKVREMPVFGLQSTADEMDTTGKNVSGPLTIKHPTIDQIKATLPNV